MIMIMIMTIIIDNISNSTDNNMTMSLVFRRLVASIFGSPDAPPVAPTPTFSKLLLLTRLY